MRDLIDRKSAIDARRYTFGNAEFSLEAAYHDCKLVFDGITDDESFQEADTGLILYYANEIIYALQEALEGKDTNGPNNNCISRQAAIDLCDWYDNPSMREDLEKLPSVQPERKTGKWIEYIPEHGKCPFCGNQVDLLGGKENNFCGECGADMRGGKG